MTANGFNTLAPGYWNMAFSLSDEQRAVRAAVREFGESEVRPVAKEYNREKRYPEKLRQQAAEYDFVAPHIPEEYGGAGMDAISTLIVTEELWRADPGVGGSIAAADFGTGMILEYGDEWMKEEWLPRITGGETPIATAISEPAHGSNVAGMETRAERDGDEWVIDGTKQWITNGPYADFVQVFARTTPQEEVGRYGGITCFLVEADEYRVSSLNNAVGLEGMQAELVFDGVRVPEDRVLGQVDGAFYQAMDFLSLGRLELGAEAIGYAEHMLELGAEYAGDREAFGRPIGKFQGVSSKLAAGRAKTYAADSAGLRCAWKMDQGESVIEDASILKYYGTNVFWDVVDDVVQIHGGNGLSEDNPFMRHLHLARILRIVEGTDEIQLNTIAKEFTGI